MYIYVSIKTMCPPAHHVPKCMSCYKAIVVKTGKANCFHDNICIKLILLLGNLDTQSAQSSQKQKMNVLM